MTARRVLAALLLALAVAGPAAAAGGGGAYDVVADPVPDVLSGVSVQVLRSRSLPGLFLSNTANRSFTVLGRDGEPFARFGPRGLEVNAASRTRLEDLAARGAPGGTPSGTPRFELLGGTGLSWVDARLRPPPGPPADDVREADGPTEVSRWEVPVELPDGTRTALTGSVRWVPAAADDDGGVPVPWAVAAGLAAGAVLAGVVVTWQRDRDRSRRQP